MQVMSIPFAAAFKAEIQRLARKEVKAQTTPLLKAVAALTIEMRTLKKRLKEAQRSTPARRSAASPLAGVPSPANSAKQLRFRADGYTSLRARLGLTAGDMAFLTGVTAQTVYARERGAKPRSAAELEAIAKLRTMPKATVHTLLAEQRHARTAP